MSLSKRSLAAVFVRKLSRALAIILLSGLAAATLIRLAPGFGMAEEELDPRLSAESVAAARERRSTGQNPFAFYAQFLNGLAHGDLGQSALFDRPVADLITDRLATTVRNVATALSVSWAVAVIAGAAIVLMGARAVVFASMAFTGFLLSVPSAVAATLCLVLYLPPALAIAAVVFARVFPHVYDQLRTSLTRPHVMMGRARGLSRTRLLMFHVLPTAALPIFALLGVSVTLALGATIPVEVLADSPGLGQLAWRAALARDFPVLVAVTLLLTTATVVANALFDTVIDALGRSTL